MALLGLVLVLLALQVLVIGHEFSHFLVARLFGFQTPHFGIGLPFGPHLNIGKKWQTQFRLHPWLFGAYCSIPELDPESPGEDSDSGSLPSPFRKFPLWQRVTVVLAGSGFYLIFAWLLSFSALYIIGEPVQQVVVKKLSSTISIASDAGVQPEDQIVGVDLQPIARTDDLPTYLRSHAGVAVTVHIKRHTHPIDISMASDSGGKVGMTLGPGNPAGYRKVTLMDSFGLATQKMYEMTVSMFAMATGGQQTQVRVHGILAVIKMATEMISQDCLQVPFIMVILSFDLAIINLIPWPGFDGSHFLAILINAARGKPLSQTRFLRWAFIVCILLTFLGSFPLFCFLRGHQRPSRH